MAHQAAVGDTLARWREAERRPARLLDPRSPDHDTAAVRRVEPGREIDLMASAPAKKPTVMARRPRFRDEIAKGPVANEQREH